MFEVSFFPESGGNAIKDYRVFWVNGNRYIYPDKYGIVSLDALPDDLFIFESEKINYEFAFDDLLNFDLGGQIALTVPIRNELSNGLKLIGAFLIAVILLKMKK